MLSSKVAFASSQRKRDGRSSIRGTPLGVCRQGRHEVAIFRVAVQRSHVPIMDVDDEDKRPFICAIFTGENLSALKPGEQRRVVLLEVTVQQEDQMRVLAVLFGVGTAVGIAASVSAAPNESSIQLAQAQDAGTQSGAGTGAGASQRGGTGNRQGGAEATGGSQERGAATRQSGDGSATVRSETTRTSSHHRS